MNVASARRRSGGRSTTRQQPSRQSHLPPEGADSVGGAGARHARSMPRAARPPIRAFSCSSVPRRITPSARPAMTCCIADRRCRPWSTWRGPSSTDGFDRRHRHRRRLSVMPVSRWRACKKAMPMRPSSYSMRSLALRRHLVRWGWAVTALVRASPGSSVEAYADGRRCVSRSTLFRSGSRPSCRRMCRS